MEIKGLAGEWKAWRGSIALKYIMQEGFRRLCDVVI